MHIWYACVSQIPKGYLILFVIISVCMCVFLTPPQNLGGVIISLQFVSVCVCVASCMSVCLSVNKIPAEQIH